MGEYKIPLHCFLSLMKHTLESYEGVGNKEKKKQPFTFSFFVKGGPAVLATRFILTDLAPLFNFFLDVLLDVSKLNIPVLILNLS